METLETVIALFEQKDYQAAKACGLRLLEHVPSFELYNLMGLITAREDLKQAKAYFYQALELKQDANVYINLGNIFQKEGNIIGAISAYKEVLKQREDPVAYNNLGSIYYRNYDLKDAIYYFNLALKLKPDYFDARYNLANCYAKLECYNEAINQYLQILEQREHYLAYYNLGFAYVAIGNYNRAQFYLEKIKDVEKDNFILQKQLAILYLENGAIEQAVVQHEQALELQVDKALVHNLAVLYLRLGKREAALNYFNMALNLDPNNKIAAHMVLALKQEKVQEVPEEYVVSLFDQYAHYYNDHLKSLNYNVPSIMRNYIAIEKGLINSTKKILDLGCGTGLCGIYFRDMASYLVGCDLSFNMLSEAKALNAYDSLCCCNIGDGIPGSNGYFDLVLAADVLVYFGDLDIVFKEVARVLNMGGIFSFTIEITSIDLNNELYTLLPTGRVTHSKRYINTLALQYGFNIKKYQDITLRRHNNEDIKGILYCLQLQHAS